MTGRRRRRRSSSSSSPSPPSKKPSPSLPLHLDHLLHLLSTTPTTSIDAALSTVTFPITPSDVETVLKLSYAHPGPAVRFFRWAASRLPSHSPYAWNLVVDLLGKNQLFDPMWDAIKSLQDLNLLSLATIASVFSSFAAADRLDDAFDAFQKVPSFGVTRDSAALNSLLSAVCRSGNTGKAQEFLARARGLALPDCDSYAILLEGWESEGDPERALEVFDEMIGVLGWEPRNVPAYDSFLATVAKGKGGMREAIRHLRVVFDKGCFPGLKFLRVAVGEYGKVGDDRGAVIVWEMMAWKNGCCPDVRAYNDMIELHCRVDRIDVSYRFMDEMVMFGVFPDENTYNVMIKYLVKQKKSKDVTMLFNEMLRNELVPTYANCKDAFSLFVDVGDADMMVNVWMCMVKNKMGPLEEDGNTLILNLRDFNMLPEACKYAEDMTEKGIKVHSSTLSKLKSSLLKVGRVNVYDQLLQKWKLH